MSKNTTDELDEIFDKMGYTKNTDFRKHAIRLITDWHNKQTKAELEAFAEEVMEETPNRKLGTIKMPLNNIEIGYNLAIQDVRKSLKAIKERWINE